MPMPEASVNKDDGPVLRKYDIRPARQACTAQTITKSSGMKALAYKDLQLRVRAPDPRHLRGPLSRGEAVGQAQPLTFLFAGFLSAGVEEAF